MKQLSVFWDWVDNRRIFRRVLLATVVSWTYSVLVWSMHFAETSDRTGAEVAMIIAAIVAPLSAVQAHALKLYTDSRDNVPTK